LGARKSTSLKLKLKQKLLSHCLSWSKFVNTHLYHSRQWFHHRHRRRSSTSLSSGWYIYPYLPEMFSSTPRKELMHHWTTNQTDSETQPRFCIGWLSNQAR